MSKIKPIQTGDEGREVLKVQACLRDYGIPISVDGKFGPKTESILKRFQSDKGLRVTGQVDLATYKGLMQYFYYPKLSVPTFAVFVDAGHGGFHPKHGYLTPGKRWSFKNSGEFHYKGNYFEGWENRVVANEFIKLLARNEIVALPVFDPVLDNTLRDRCDKVLQYMDAGFYGPLISFHSNAISTEGRTQNDLDRVRGLGVYTTTKDNTSDEVGKIHLKSLRKQFPTAKIRLGDDGATKERNFMIMRETEKHFFTQLGLFGAILEEFDFHTSTSGAKFIMGNRRGRVNAALRTVLASKPIFDRKLEENGLW